MSVISRRQALSGLGGVALAGLAFGHGREEPGRRAPGTLLWRTQAGNGHGGLPFPLVAGDGTVYAGSNAQPDGDCVTYALDASTGRPAWHTRAASGPVPAAAGGGAVYGFQVAGPVTGRNMATSVVALSARSGQQRWTYDAGDLLQGADFGWLDYVEDTVFVGKGTLIAIVTIEPVAPTTAAYEAATYDVAALDARTGRPRWTMPVSKNSPSPAVADGLLYTAEGNEISALDAVTGTRRWRSRAPGSVNELAAANGIVCGWTRWSVAAFTAGTGRLLWQLSTQSFPVDMAGDVLVLEELKSTTQIVLHAIQASTGRQLWSRTLPQSMSGMAAAGGVLYLSNGSVVSKLAAATGDTRWSYRLAAEVTGIATGTQTVYAADSHGTVYAVQA
jgi:outer membrane protein assembly factor BamB